MSVLKNKDGTELLIDCNCGCDSGIRFRIDKDDFDCYCVASYTNGKYYTDSTSVWGTFCNKWKKIWAIIRNKDHYYTEFFMNKNEFDEFKEYINSI